MVEIEEFDFEIEHRPGKNMPMPCPGSLASCVSSLRKTSPACPLQINRLIPELLARCLGLTSTPGLRTR